MATTPDRDPQTGHPDAAPAHPARRRVLTGLIFAQVMIGLSNGITLSMGSLLAASLAGPVWGGSAATLTTIGAAIFAVPLARMVQRHDRRTSLSTGMLIGSLGAVLSIIGAQFSIFPVVLLAFLFLGAMSAVNLQARFAATDVAGEKTRGSDLSLVVWSTTIGAIAGPNLFTPSARFSAALGLEEHAGAYLLCLVGQLIAIMVWWFTLPRGLKPAPDTSPAQSPVARLTPLARRAITSIAIAHFSMVGLMSMAAVHMQGHGAGLTLIGLTISLHVAGMYALSPLFGVLTDKVGRSYTIFLGFGMLLVAACSLIFFPESERGIITAMIFLGLGWNATLVASSALLNDATPTRHHARTQGRSDLVMNLAGASGGLLAGPVIGLAGMPALAGLVFVVVAVQAGLMALSIRRLGTKKTP
ncbi:Major Facilitator Superfamily protein [Corynebacterium occultum]|uniref:Major Facilitator Superfamily protein n=1 Tax=Corynebacterium occultum TaxID=2675219 RepID=A0A6B8W725_9CORY|nr:MFS transporter [Corynebacterium occultum]QGU08441.1 Major Facilitator Superfamily protein [Corynebacterium occultum]